MASLAADHHDSVVIDRARRQLAELEVLNTYAHMRKHTQTHMLMRSLPTNTRRLYLILIDQNFSTYSYIPLVGNRKLICVL